MPTAQQLPAMPSHVFGDLGGTWFIEQHTESMSLGIATLRIQTSGHQTNDQKNGSWHAALTFGAATLAQTQFDWCSPDDARAKALAWARDSLRGVAAEASTVDTVLEPELVDEPSDASALPSA